MPVSRQLSQCLAQSSRYQEHTSAAERSCRESLVLCDGTDSSGTVDERRVRPQTLITVMAVGLAVMFVLATLHDTNECVPIRAYRPLIELRPNDYFSGGSLMTTVYVHGDIASVIVISDWYAVHCVHCAVCSHYLIGLS